MNKIADQTDWHSVSNEMHEKGFSVIPKFLMDKQCNELIRDYDNPNAYRKTVVMERYRFGLGEYKYFNYPLPDLIQSIRTSVYSQLAPIANAWFNALGIDQHFPPSHQEFLQQCQLRHQQEATVLILKYGKGRNHLRSRLQEGSKPIPRRGVDRVTKFL